MVLGLFRIEFGWIWDAAMSSVFFSFGEVKFALNFGFGLNWFEGGWLLGLFEDICWAKND